MNSSPHLGFILMKQDTMIFRREPLVLLGPAILAGVFVSPASADVHAQGSSSNLVRQSLSGVEIKTDDCLIAIRPISPKRIRVRCAKESAAESPEYRSAQAISRTSIQSVGGCRERCRCHIEDESNL